MSNSNTLPEALEKLALEAIARREKVEDIVLLRVDKDTVPSTKASIFRFTASKRRERNGAHYNVVLDEAGAVVDLPRLGEKEKKKFFDPAAHPFEPKPVKDGKITINPTSNDLVFHPGDTFCEDITVGIPEFPCVTKKVDVYFLADTTGSMGDEIEAVKSKATDLLASLKRIPCTDFAFGAGNYKDFYSTPPDPYAFQPQLSLTTSTPAVVSAINSWSASGGDDVAEGQFFALDQIADPSIGWRPGSERILIWFGDAPGHDPICAGFPGVATTITENAVIVNKLQPQGIKVIALNTSSGAGLDDDPVAYSYSYPTSCPIGGSLGQATRIASATGGKYEPNITAANIVTTIYNLIVNAVKTIANLNLVATGSIAPFVTINPPGGYGPLLPDEAHRLNFDVLFKGVMPCCHEDQVFTGTIDAVADGVVVARKKVKITVPACRYTYSVKFVCGLQPECDCEHAPVRPGAYATEINIHNFNEQEAKIEKRIIPVVFAGAAAGREPKFAGVKAKDKITLPANSATMDDCFRLGELLLGAPPPSPMPLTIGFLEIISDRELNVTAVYTASDPKSGGLSIDVEQIEGRHR